MAKQSIATIRRKALYPWPVYQAEFHDGTVGRMTFYQEAGKPWDFARGRRLCEHYFGKPICAGVVEQNFSGYIEPSQPWRRVDDPMMDEQPKAKRVTAKQLKALLARMMELPDVPSTMADEARELLAA